MKINVVKIKFFLHTKEVKSCAGTFCALVIDIYSAKTSMNLARFLPERKTEKVKWCQDAKKS